MAKLIVISPTPTHPQDAGNRARIFSLLTALKAAGHQICFVFVKMETGDETTMAKTWDEFYTISYHCPRERWLKRIADFCSRRIGCKFLWPYGIDDWYAPEISLRLQDIRQQANPDAVIIEYVFLSRAFECFGEKIFKILDTHDVFGDRHRMYLKNDVAQQWFYTKVTEEQKALDRANLVLAIQKNEAAYFSRLTKRPVITVGHLIPEQKKNEHLTGENNRLLFVGSGNPININALNWFIKNVFPMIRKLVPEVELDIVGDSAGAFPPGKGIIMTGNTTDLTAHYGKAKAVINPIQFGTGLKIKTIEALAMRKPLITTTVGAAGLEEWKGKAFLCADSPEEFAKCVLQVLSSPDLQDTLTRHAADFTRTNNENAVKPLLDIMHLHLSDNHA